MSSINKIEGIRHPTSKFEGEKKTQRRKNQALAPIIQTLASRTPNLQAPSLLLAFPPLIMWNGRLNQEFGWRNWKKPKVFGYGNEREEGKKRERLGLRFGVEKRGNPYKSAAKRCPIKIKHVAEKSGRKINPLEPFSESVRADGYREQHWIQSWNLAWGSGWNFARAQVGWIFEGFPDSESSETKFKSNLDNFSIRTQRCNSRRQTPWHANPEIKNVRNAHQHESNPRAKMFLRLQYLF